MRHVLAAFEYASRSADGFWLRLFMRDGRVLEGTASWRDGDRHDAVALYPKGRDGKDDDPVFINPADVVEVEIVR